MVRNERYSYGEWYIDDCQIPMGRKFNELRRSILVAETEVERLSGLFGNGGSLIDAYRAECGNIQVILEEVHDGIFLFPTIMELTNQMLTENNPTPEMMQYVRSQQIGYNTDVVRARNIEIRINSMTDLLPTIMQTYLFQVHDALMTEKLEILNGFVRELLERFRIEAEMILSAGDKYSATVLNGISNKFAIVMIPMTKMDNPIEWIPLAHEFGHVLLDSSSLGEDLYNSFWQILVAKIGFEIEEDILTISWNWFNEIFADLCMVETLKIAAIGFSGIHRAFSSNYATSRSHPPDILRVRFMIDYVSSRWDLTDFVEQYQRGFDFSRLENQGELDEEWGRLVFWQDSDFRVRILEIITNAIERIIGSSDLDNSVAAFRSLLDGSDLNSYSICDILSALPIAFIEGRNPEHINIVYEELRQRIIQEQPNE